MADLGARAATAAEAARAGDWVVVGIPLAAYRQLPAADLAGKLVLDTSNYAPPAHRRPRGGLTEPPVRPGP